VVEYDVISREKLRCAFPDGDLAGGKVRRFWPAKDIILFFPHADRRIDFANLSRRWISRTGLRRPSAPRSATGTAAGKSARTPSSACWYSATSSRFARRHHFTTDLVGRAYTWAVQRGDELHPRLQLAGKLQLDVFQGDNSGGATWSSPCFFIKLRDDAYLFQWVEENCNGSQGLMVFNPNILHDSGFFFGLMHGELALNVTGAYARSLGKFEIMRYYDKTGNL
jgi:hypothetical protein